MIKPFYIKKKNIDDRLVPAVSAADAGKVLGVTEDGKIAAVEAGGGGEAYSLALPYDGTPVELTEVEDSDEAEAFIADFRQKHPMIDAQIAYPLVGDVTMRLYSNGVLGYFSVGSFFGQILIGFATFSHDGHTVTIAYKDFSLSPNE